MTTSRVRAAIARVTEEIRAGKTVALPDAIAGDSDEEVYGYILTAYERQARGDAEGVKHAVRGAGRFGASTQMELPGMEHAALLAVVFEPDPVTGVPTAIPYDVATKGQQRKEIRQLRRSVTVQDRVVAGLEATLDRLDELGVDDEVTGAEITAMFTPEIEQ